jgi:hypothetical protein
LERLRGNMRWNIDTADLELLENIERPVSCIVLSIFLFVFMVSFPSING